jgi:DNA polymerase-4
MILHVDMDAFYASVEQRDRPELRGKPVIVGGGADRRGVVCAASYEARRFGVRSAMPSGQAHRLCPTAVFIPPRMDHYARISGHIREIFLSFTPLVEPISLDEAFLDVRGCEALFGQPAEIARQIKATILAQTQLIASVGVAPNKFLAKLASDTSKPNGLLIVEPDRVAEFLRPMPVSRIWGVGAKSEKRLNAFGLRTIGDLVRMPERLLVEQMGESGRWIWRLAHGLDERPVVPDRQAKSISTETTFVEDIGDFSVLRTWLLQLVEQLGQRLRHCGLRARTVELKIRSSRFETYTRSHTLAEPSDLTAILWQAAAKLLEQRLPPGILPVRLLGVGASGLVQDEAVQGNLFDDGWQSRQRSLDQALDRIRNHFGAGTIRRGIEPGA